MADEDDLRSEVNALREQLRETHGLMRFLVGMARWSVSIQDPRIAKPVIEMGSIVERTLDRLSPTEAK
jgi:hypothetical protein